MSNETDEQRYQRVVAMTGDPNAPAWNELSDDEKTAFLAIDAMVNRVSDAASQGLPFDFNKEILGQ